MKLFMACLGTETNTFSPIPTGNAGFAETMLFRGDATQHEANLFSVPLHVWRRAAEADGIEVAEGLATFAQPAGVTVRRTYEAFRDELLEGLRAAMPVDMVLLSMHGAMVADGYNDCEGDVLTRVREITGDKVAIGTELDLHCSVTPDMQQAADVLITFKEYPHIDSAERAAELYRICRDTARGEVRPVMVVQDTRMVSAWRTTFEPMASFVRRMQAAEAEDGILSVSFAHGFPWGDVPCVTARMVVVADGDADKAAALAETLCREVWEMREATRPRFSSLDDALAVIRDPGPGPLVLADVADNAGGGAPSDSTFILKALVEAGIGNIASGIYWDPMAVRHAMAAGEGATLELRVGGKACAASGLPIDLPVTVKRIIEDATQPFGKVAAPMGTAIWVTAPNQLDLILNATRTQTFHPQAFTQFGIDLSAKRAVVVKSSQHFHAGFSPLATEIIYVGTQGALTSDFAAIPYTKLDTPFWPRVDDPWA